MTTLGVILGGGRSSRFGSDKAEAILGSRRLVDHALDALSPHCDRIAVAGRFHEFVLSIPDRPRVGLGPLGGIAGALQYASTHDCDQVLSIPVDCVRLPSDLRDLLEPPPSFAADQPVIGLWPVSALAELDAMFREGVKPAVRAFASRIGARRVEMTCALPNINRPEDLVVLTAFPGTAA